MSLIYSSCCSIYLSPKSDEDLNYQNTRVFNITDKRQTMYKIKCEVVKIYLDSRLLQNCSIDSILYIGSYLYIFIIAAHIECRKRWDWIQCYIETYALLWLKRLD